MIERHHKIQNCISLVYNYGWKCTEGHMDLLLIFKLMQRTYAISKIHSIPKNPNHLSNRYSERRASKNSKVQISLLFFWDTLMCCAKLSIPNVFLYIYPGTNLEVWIVKAPHLMLFYWHRYIFLFHVFIMDKLGNLFENVGHNFFNII